MHDSIILLSFGALFIHTWPLMAAQQSIFVEHVKIVFVQVGMFALCDGISGSFHNKATIPASALHCVLWQNLDEDSFVMLYKIIVEQPSLTQYEQPMYHMKWSKSAWNSVDWLNRQKMEAEKQDLNQARHPLETERGRSG